MLIKSLAQDIILSLIKPSRLALCYLIKVTVHHISLAKTRFVSIVEPALLPIRVEHISLLIINTFAIKGSRGMIFHIEIKLLEFSLS